MLFLSSSLASESSIHFILWYILSCCLIDFCWISHKRVLIFHLLIVSGFLLYSSFSNWYFSVSHMIHVLQDLQRFPRIRIKLRLKNRDERPGSSCSLNVRLENVNAKRKTPRAFAPRFPKVIIYSRIFWPKYWLCLTCQKLVSNSYIGMVYKLWILMS